MRQVQLLLWNNGNWRVEIRAGTCLILVLRRPRWEDYESKASLHYKAKPDSRTIQVSPVFMSALDYGTIIRGKRWWEAVE